jgi:integrase
VAAHVSQEVLAEKGSVPGSKRSGPTLKEAIAESIRLSRQRDYVRKDSASRAGLFLAWMDDHFPKVALWHELKPYMVQEWVRNMESRGLAHFTVRNHLRPILAAWKWVHENYPEAVKSLPKIRLSSPSAREIECLEPAEVKALLGYLEDREPDLYCMACLQALAGLRTLEASSLRRQDVALQRGTVRVTDTGYHKPKTAGSERIIPVCSEVLQALAGWMNSQKVIPATGELFLTRLGTHWTPSGLNHRWAKKSGGVLLKAARETGIPRLAEVQPHRLRSSFATMAGRLGVPDRLLKAYLGHSPGDVLGEHYRKITLAELGMVSSLMNGWQTLEDGRSDWNNSGHLRETAPVTG